MVLEGVRYALQADMFFHLCSEEKLDGSPPKEQEAPL